MTLWIADSKIGIDIDDVLFDLVSNLAEFHNLNWGTSFTKEDFHSYRFSEVFNCSREEARVRVDAFLDSSYFENMLPLAGAVEGVERLIKQNNKLELITARDKRFKDLTIAQIGKHFPVLKNLPHHFSKNAYTGHGNETKWEICKKGKFGYMIEDSPVYAQECSKHLTALLMEQPWNRNLLTSERIIGIGWRDLNS